MSHCYRLDKHELALNYLTQSKVHKAKATPISLILEQKTTKPKLDGFDSKLLVQQHGCFLPGLFLTAYAAGHTCIEFLLIMTIFLAAYAAGHC
ncbi:hypothetical protein [Vibrio coralliilyticus]|uniref:hypothetical protein n=1 Tax=Vibrio coralliilyticus TaxID=190893 RepID=UPI0015616688|nr:hypothetical protein [Vibrio coralliilyticus]NRF28649.1 hypothetical protein [Vibrio coralliilyticus]NRF51540.1 hypothetical protein [Vibrio coralliilyticus]NRG06044.1 hypothetical protein [Vibrio coralliilyticus]